MIIDHSKVQEQRKRSSLRSNHLFNTPEEYAEWIANQKNKTLKWDETVEKELPKHSQFKADKYKKLDTHFTEVVRLIIIHRTLVMTFTCIN